MWIVVGDEWFKRAFNRRKYYEVHSEQGFALPPKGQAGRH